MRKEMIAAMLVAAVCIVASAGVALADGDFNHTYNNAFHVWNVCDRCVDRCDEPCAPKCAPKCEPRCEEPCSPEDCTPPPCPEPTGKCCPAPVDGYPAVCPEGAGEFDRNGRSRSNA